ncbi:hypothetical protein [Acidovorax sp.]|uniref:hypothetical protein n=1 Tax=Acidovorax sp. TaxID=1872122 RepID=UPI0025C22B04|nr:hypothetical protein [Acidovorax sp.]MBL7089129.1 hypothetical protein [Acidovorax sp.]
MSALPAIIGANKARTASTDAALLVKAAMNAQGALQWAMAANLYDQAAAALPADPHTGKETMQAQAHRRSARNCQALVGTTAPPRAIKDAPDYGHMTRQAIAQHDEEWRGHGL